MTCSLSRQGIGLCVFLIFAGLIGAGAPPAQAAGPGRYCGLPLYPNAVPQGVARRNHTNFALTRDRQKEVVDWYAHNLPLLRQMPESGGRVLLFNTSAHDWSFVIDSVPSGQTRIVFNCDWPRRGGN